MSLTLINITKKYASKNILKNFGYNFKEKGLYVIFGESGIGKTTLLRIICGFDKKFDGQVIGGGFQNCSVVFQEYRLFPNLNALQNITEVSYKKSSSSLQEEAVNLLKQMKFTEEDMFLYPEELSGGMKQRVSVARAILKDAPVLLLDEPTKELDNDTAKTVLNLIYEQSKHRLVLLVTHNMEELFGMKFDTILIE